MPSTMRAALAALAAVVLLAGCGGEPLPDEATSRAMVERTVLDWHRFQAEGNGEAGCRLLTEEQQEGAVESDREIAELIGTEAADDCAEAVAKIKRFSDTARQLFLNTQVDAVRLEGERATATVHTSAVVNGATHVTQPVDIPLRWDGGRWLIG
jgi:hypothetical protein